MARIEGEGKLHSQPTTIPPSLQINNYISPFSLTFVFTSAAKSVWAHNEISQRPKKHEISSANKSRNFIGGAKKAQLSYGNLTTVTQKSVTSTKEILQEKCAASRQHEISKHYLIRKWHCKRHHQISLRNLMRNLCSKQQQISQGHLITISKAWNHTHK